MPEGIPAVRYLLHKVCAYPFGICWVIGTLSIWIPLSTGLARSGTFQLLLEDWTIVPLLLLGYVSTSGLGLFAGAFFTSWLILPACRNLRGILKNRHAATLVSIRRVIER